MSGAATARPIYFVGKWVDFIFMGGFALALYLAVVLADRAGVGRSLIMTSTAPLMLTWVANNPHFAATNSRLYDSRASVLRFPFTALALPVLMVLLTASAFFYPSDFAPTLIKVYVLWAPYHFAAQTLGITLLYAQRAGIAVGRWERRALSGFLFAVTTRATIINEGAGRTGNYFNVTFPNLVLPGWCTPAATAWLLATGAALALVLWRWRARLPLILIVPLVAHLLWFTDGPRRANYLELINAFHSLQYLVIAYALQVRARPEGGVAWTSLRWAGGNVAIGALLFYVLPPAVARAGHASATFAVAVVWTALQLHHYFVDGVIWKLRSPQVAPLLGPAAAPVALAS
jgi:hypothetical protein